MTDLLFRALLGSLDTFVLFQSVLFFYAKVLSEIGKLISSKTVRKELRKHQRVAAERMCDICQHNVLPGKDVATLMNMKTGRLVCSSRNVNGAFHVFHTSCLVHWMLLTELEIHNNQNAAGSEVKQRGRKKVGDPLDFRLANTATHSVQSTSLTDQQPEQFVISEAKGSFALANSPPGDSVESSGRPGVPLAYEPNSADNLMFFDGENSIPTGDRSLFRSNKET
ncbi:hypothetical protein AgCh_004940 [Apium graveolens]